MRSDEFLFGPFTLVAALPRLMEDGVLVRVGSRALAIPILFVKRAPQTVSHAEILAYVWSDTLIDQINLRERVSQQQSWKGWIRTDRALQGTDLNAPKLYRLSIDQRWKSTISDLPVYGLRNRPTIHA